MANFLDALNTVIWSPVLVFLCLGAGIYFTVVTRGLQAVSYTHLTLPTKA